VRRFYLLVASHPQSSIRDHVRWLFPLAPEISIILVLMFNPPPPPIAPPITKLVRLPNIVPIFETAKSATNAVTYIFLTRATSWSRAFPQPS
jgi:hypothetical protein